MAKVLSDIEIAQQTKLEPITAIANQVGLTDDDLELYGKYKAKISFDAIKRLSKNEDGKLVLVTAITPTPAGEGKTLTTIGLAQALNYMGHKAVVALREPSLGRSSASKAVLPAVVTPSSADGRHQPAFYRRHACHYGCQQPLGRSHR